MPGDKSPRPDGFTWAFFKQCSDIIQHDLTSSLNQLYNTCTAKISISSTRPTLSSSPKKPDAIKVSDCRSGECSFIEGSLICNPCVLADFLCLFFSWKRRRATLHYIKKKIRDKNPNTHIQTHSTHAKLKIYITFSPAKHKKRTTKTKQPGHSKAKVPV